MTEKDVTKDYIFLASIGSGSFGKVHKVQSRTNSLTYACKEIDYTKMQDKEKKLLVHEVNTLKELNNQNIVRYVDRYVDKAKQKIFIIMEYCENGDLARYIKRHKSERKYISEDKIWSVLVQLCNALKYCHVDICQTAYKQKVIHRDIKPGNVFLAKDGSIKLGDFGLCRSLNEDSQAATNVGTPLYMPPEILGKQQYSEKADIWSLGCVVYELAALQPPFAASNMDSLKVKVRQGARPPLPSCYSQEMRKIIDMMLENSQTKRSSVIDLLKYPKIIEMQQRMQQLGMPGGLNAPAAAPTAPINVEKQLQEVEQVLMGVNPSPQEVKKDEQSKEEYLAIWEARLIAKEEELNEREEKLKTNGY
ncbi:Kinase, NEK [Spironucleus salmonicida]|uniref:non-specific serine/threonine protein kinase n=1 Tax=Spironucleus salmonicida TaxID=348837 RepID=V6LS69_9EUKA|nr:Kinase, NEK [Spironucleus salmonicida]|eukprot:EST47420.1 Kinase, NEK [Spironucleus salmonicida]